MGYVLIPSWVLVMLMGMNAGILLYLMIREKVLTPLALFFPLLILAIIYTLVDYLNIFLARSLSRFGLALLLLALLGIVFQHSRLRRGG